MDGASTETPSVTAPSSPSNLTDEMRLALGTLSESQRLVLSLFYVEGMGVAEVAQVLDVPVGTVKSRLFHARKALAAAFAKRAEKEMTQ